MSHFRHSFSHNAFVKKFRYFAGNGGIFRANIIVFL